MSRPIIMCPHCRHDTPWINGRVKAAGDEIDEIWCVVCGTATELSEAEAAQLSPLRYTRPTGHNAA